MKPRTVIPYLYLIPIAMALTQSPALTASAPPAVFANGTVNAASFASGTTPLAPGTIVAIFGTNLNDGSSDPSSSFGFNGRLLFTLGGASVTLNGVVSAPMFSSFPSQLNVQIPFELASGTSAQVVVAVAGQNSTPQSVPLGPVSPGLFSLASNGKGQGAIQIANTAIVAAPSGCVSGAQARPANVGEFLSIYCTGLGAVTNPPATGTPAGSSPLSETLATTQVAIGGISVASAFSGLAPGFVGLYQVNVKVPQGSPTGDAIPVVLTVGGIPSNTVTIALQ